jgi:menaquinone-specific isochorismate synthase
MTATSTAAGRSSALVARTRTVEPPVRLLDALAPDGFAWLRDGAGIVTAGVVARIPVPLADRALAAVKVDDPVRAAGTGAIAVGALPFGDAAGGELTIPASVTGVDADGRAWRTEIGPVSEPTAAVSPRAPATRFDVEGRVSRSAWSAQVGAVLDAIRAKDVEKVVLAREVDVHADAPFDVPAVVERLCATQGGCAVFADAGQRSALVGASPELLVRRRGRDVLSRPMAGTVPRGATDDGDRAAAAALAASAKDGLEHRLVIEAVVDGLRECGVEVTAVHGPEVARLATVLHLATTIAGTVDERSASTALDLALRLHPTPAVAGAPRDAALAMLRQLESFDRGCYAGPVGWVDAHGDGEWAVALRCAELDGTTARLVAGAGVVAGSDPDAEWAETQAKLEPMLRVLVQP